MANHKSAEKRARVIKRKTLRNQMVKSALKTAIKRFTVAIEANDAEKAADYYKAAASKLDSAVSKGVVHKNTAARKKSRLALKLNSMAK